MQTEPQKNHYYTIYGLQLIADRPLPEALPAPPPVPGSDPLTVTLAGCIEELPVQPPADQAPWYTSPYQDEHGAPVLRVWRDKTRYYLVYLNGNRFVVDRAGDAVWAAWPEETDFGFVVAQLLGPILGFVLQLRGLLVLHASVVAAQGQALAILGASGAGKSTTAAELCRQGCRVLSDDVAALAEQDDWWWAQPGYPRLRLWPQTAEALYGPEHDLRPIAPGSERWDKRYLELDRSQMAFASQPHPLRAIYVLDWSEANAGALIAPLMGAPGLAALDANSYAIRLLDHEGRARQLAALGRLLGRVSVRRMQPTANLAALPALGAAILKDFERLLTGGVATGPADHQTLPRTAHPAL